MLMNSFFCSRGGTISASLSKRRKIYWNQKLYVFFIIYTSKFHIIRHNSFRLFFVLPPDIMKCMPRITQESVKQKKAKYLYSEHPYGLIVSSGFFLLLHFFSTEKRFGYFSFVISSFYMVLWKRPKRHTYTQNKMEQHNNNKTKNPKRNLWNEWKEKECSDG